MADTAAIRRWFPGRGQRCQNFAEFCFDRGVDSLPQLEIISRIPSGRGCQRRHYDHRDSFVGSLFTLPDQLLHHQHLHAGIAFDLDFLFPSRNRHSPGARGPWNIGNHRQRDRLYDPIFGAAHSATTFMVLFFAAIWWTTRMLFRIDTNRMVAEGARQKQEEQVRQLNIEKIAAERASQAKDDFLAVLSHELRTPLTPALAAASYLAEHENLSPELHEEVVAIRTSVQLEARLIDDLLDLTRITRGKIELHLEVVDVHGLLRNSLEIARDNILQKQLDLVIDFCADRHHVWADPVRLQQVFWNLINNAVKFTKKNGRITVRTVNEDGRFVFQITDTGVGIEPEQLHRIFQAFEQGERSISRRFGGLGLGLTISKRLLELQGGTITVQSEGLNRGASFKLTLASVEPPKTTSVSRLIADEGPAKSLQLLVVEDHPQTLRVLAALLRNKA